MNLLTHVCAVFLASCWVLARPEMITVPPRRQGRLWALWYFWKSLRGNYDAGSWESLTRSQKRRKRAQALAKGAAILRQNLPPQSA